MNPMFSVTAIKSMYHLMAEELQELKQYLFKQDLSKSINMNDILQKVALVSAPGLFINTSPQTNCLLGRIDFSGLRS